MRAFAATVVLASFMGGLTSGAEAMTAWLTATRSSASSPEELPRPARTVEILHALESEAEPEPTRIVLPVQMSAPFDDASAQAQLTELASSVGMCAVQGPTRGRGSAEVSFARNGHVMRVAVDRGFFGTPVGACITRRLAHATVAPFDGEPRTIAVRFAV